MAQFIEFNCTQCRKITRHDILKRTNGTDTILLRISCTKCAMPSFQINFPKEIVEANIQEDKPSLPADYYEDSDPGDCTNFH